MMKLCLLVPLAVMIMFSCVLPDGEDAGTLLIRFTGEGRGIIWDLGEISGYVITLKRTGFDDITATHQKGEGYLLLHAVPGGIWKVSVDAVNEDGVKIGHMDNGPIDVNIKRGEKKDAVVEVTIVPYTEGTGTLEMTIQWQQIEGDQRIVIQISCINENIDGYTEHTGSVKVNYSGAASGTTDLVDGELDEEIKFSASWGAQVITLEGLPSGWYQVDISSEPNDDTGDDFGRVFLVSTDLFPEQREGIQRVNSVIFVRIGEDGVTKGTLTAALVDGIPRSYENSIIPCGDNTPKVGMELRFSSSYENPGAQYRWYINGELLDDETSHELKYRFSDTGVWQIGLSVFQDGVWFGSSEDVEIEGYDIGDTGPGGGKIFFDKGISDARLVRWDEASNGYITAEGSAESPWRYLEAAPGSWERGEFLFSIFTDSEQVQDPGGVDPIYQWGSPIEGITRSSLGAGRKNTENMLAENNVQHAALAVSLCREGGFDDWFLPSIDELSLMQEHLDINDFFDEGYYWSSTESDDGTAWVKDIRNNVKLEKAASEQHRIRPVRAF